MWEKYERLKWHTGRMGELEIHWSVSLPMVIRVRSEGGEFKHKYSFGFSSEVQVCRQICTELHSFRKLRYCQRIEIKS